ncbi:MAG: hypothetical protein JW818_17245 [Pirellulales bacterium]|nr:hypothetical protein [Pirellulales bacterium]
MEYYRHSGAVSPVGLVMTFLAGLATACVLAIVYSLLIVHVPFIYVNFLATAGFGVAIGMAIGHTAKAGKIRNPMVIGVFGLIFGLMGLYIAWGVDLIARVGFPDYVLAFHPRWLAHHIAIFYEEGYWGFGEKPVTGIVLAIVWLIEAGVIIGLATLIAYGVTATLTFCERCGTWNQLEEDVRRLVIGPGQEAVLERLKTGDLTVLMELSVAPPEASVYLRVDLAHCATCSDSAYVTVQMVTETVDKDGDVSTNANALLTNLLIAESDLAHLREIGQPMPEPESPPPIGPPPGYAGSENPGA